MLRELRSVVGLQELLYVIFGIEDFAVYTVVWEISLVAVVLRGASADTEFVCELRVGHEAFTSEQGVITFSQILTFGGDVVSYGVEARYAWVVGCYQFLHTLSFPTVINPATSEPLNCDSLPRCEYPILPRSLSKRNLRSDMWRKSQVCSVVSHSESLRSRSLSYRADMVL